MYAHVVLPAGNWFLGGIAEHGCTRHQSMAPVIIGPSLNLVSVGPMAAVHLADATTTGNLKIYMLCMYICVLQHIYALYSVTHAWIHKQAHTD